jgi:hypothetical protein
LLQQFRDNRFAPAEAASFADDFISGLPTTNTKGEPEPYTREEYLASLRSVYSRAPREPLAPGALAVVDNADLTAIDADVVEGIEPIDTVEADEPIEADEVDGGRLNHAAILGNSAATAPPICLQPGLMIAVRAAAAAERRLQGDCVSVCSDATTHVRMDDDASASINATDGPTGKSGATHKQQTRARAALKTHLKLDVQRVVKYGEANGAYALELADGRSVALGRANPFNSATAFRVSVLDALNIQVPRFKSGAWTACLDSMLTLLEVKPGLTAEEMVTEWLEAYLKTRAIDVASSLNPVRTSPRSSPISTTLTIMLVLL